VLNHAQDNALVEVAQRHWLATNPNTKGDNCTWALWFNTNTLSDGSGFHEKWKAYRLGGAASAGLTPSLPMVGSNTINLGVSWGNAAIAALNLTGRGIDGFL
jgi:hypothetical protein